MNNLQVLDGLRVLVVDDNKDNLMLIQFIFEEYNAQVTLVTSASADSGSNYRLETKYSDQRYWNATRRWLLANS